MCSSAHEDSRGQSFWKTNKNREGEDILSIGIIDNRYVHSIKFLIQVVTETQCNEWTTTSTLKPENHYTIKNQQTICQNCQINYKECNICIHKYTCTCPDSLYNVTKSKHIYLVIRCINSNLNYIPVEALNVPMKSLNVWNEEIFYKVKVLGEQLPPDKIYREIWIIYIPY